jgi:hypothetical protein
VRYCYCPKCKLLRPRNWYGRGECERCGSECIAFTVKRTYLGILMYLFDLLAAILLIFYVARTRFGADFAAFVDSSGPNNVVVIIFLLILLSFIFAYFDIARTTKTAQEMVERGLVRPKEES